MTLEKYLAGLKACPDEAGLGPRGREDHRQLTTRYGIYDNYRMLWAWDFDQVMAALPAFDFRVDKNIIYKGRPYGHAWHNSGGVRVQIFDMPIPIMFGEKPRETEHYQRQMRNFQTTLMFHPERFGLDDWPRKVANAVTGAARYAIDRGVAICLVDSAGTEAYETGDFSGIVYYYPRPRARKN